MKPGRGSDGKKDCERLRRAAKLPFPICVPRRLLELATQACYVITKLLLLLLLLFSSFCRTGRDLGEVVACAIVKGGSKNSERGGRKHFGESAASLQTHNA